MLFVYNAGIIDRGRDPGRTPKGQEIVLETLRQKDTGPLIFWRVRKPDKGIVARYQPFAALFGTEGVNPPQAWVDLSGKRTEEGCLAGISFCPFFIIA